MKSYMLAILGAEYVTGIVPKGSSLLIITSRLSSELFVFVGTHDWNKFIFPHELEAMVRASHPRMEIKSIQGMTPSADLRSKSLTWNLSDSDTDVNYILHAIKRES